MDQIRIVFLGTGAAAPTRDRNVSSVAVVLDGRVLLFDCGEGTQHQLMRSPVRSGAIEAIYITHLHGDHLFGLPGLIATLGLNLRTDPLTVYGPSGLRGYLESIPYLGATYPLDIIEITPNVDPGSADRRVVTALPPASRKGAPATTGPQTSPLADPPAPLRSGYRVEAALLEHAIPCYGYAIVEDERPGAFDVEKARAAGVPDGPLFGRLQRGEDVVIEGRIVRSAEVVGPRRQGRRIVFCTDTRPCDAAIELARGADVFIHEATYANDHALDAVDRYHATAEEAAHLAAAAQPQRLILTHVSARYETPAPLLAESRPIFAKTEVAHDLLVVAVPPR